MIDERLDSILEAVGTIKAAAENKQDKLTVDDSVNQGSTNPVQGGAVKTYVDDAVSTASTDLTNEIDYQIGYLKESGFDDDLSDSSRNAVQNKVVKAALDNKQDSLTMDSVISDQSDNPVKNSAIKAALDAKQDRLTIDSEIDTNVPPTSTNPVQNKAIAAKFNAMILQINSALSGKQDTLSDGANGNIKTINGQSILGSGDLVIQGGGSADIKSWADVQKIVQSGKSKDIFTVGVDQFVCDHSTYGTLVWDIIGLNQDVAVDSEGNILYQYVDSDVMDYYSMKLTGDGTTTQFVLFDRPKEITAVYIDGISTTNYTYTTNSYLLAFTNSVVPSNGAEIVIQYNGRLMPTMTIQTHNTMDTMYITGASWDISSMRTHLNSDESGGWLYGLDADLKSVIGTVRKLSSTSMTVPSSTVDKVFVPSTYEVYGESLTGNQFTYQFYGAGRSSLQSPSYDVDSNRKRGTLTGGNSNSWLRTSDSVNRYYFINWFGSIDKAYSTGPSSQSNLVAPVVVIM